MSIPGLGQIPAQPAASSTRSVVLKPAWEWRFDVATGRSVVVKLAAGTADKEGVELAPRTAYTLTGTRSSIITWTGCELLVEGRCDDESVAQYAHPTANPANSFLNLHAALAEMRATAARLGCEGPRLLIVGAPAAGKTTLARTLTSYATRQGHQPLVVNADPRQAMLSLPGTLTTAVFATVMDPEAVDGWGSTPISGPSPAPVKLPLVYYHGRESAEDDAPLYKDLIGRLASAVSARLRDDSDVRSAGIIVDGMRIAEDSSVGIDLIAHVVDELSVNMVIVLGSDSISTGLTTRFGSQRTSLGEPIQVLALERSDGAVERDEGTAEHLREQIIKEYFFGSARRSLSPQIQQMDFDNLIIYKAPEDTADGQEACLVREEPSSVMQHWTLAVMHASTKDTPETVRVASVMGFVYVSDVDEQRRKIKLLAPVGGRLGDRPLVWGKWPEPYMNLLG